MDEEKKFEKLTGNLMTRAAVTATAAVAATSAVGLPLIAAAAAIPVLFDSLAGRRQQERLEVWIQQVSEDLSEVEAQLVTLTDEQYQLINDTVSAASQTINLKKLEYLRTAVRNSVSIQEVDAQEAHILARLIRDISAEEADFLVRNFSYKYVVVSDVPRGDVDTLTVPKNTPDSLVMNGLEMLGILEVGMILASGGSLKKFAAVTSKLLVLLRT